MKRLDYESLKSQRPKGKWWIDKTLVVMLLVVVGIAVVFATIMVGAIRLLGI